MGQSFVGIVIQSILVGGLFGFIAYVIVDGPIALLTGKKKKFEDKIQKAIEQGHCVRARLIRCYDDVENYGKKQHSYIADYEYYVNGKRYKRTYDYYRKPTHNEIDLYWFNNPAKADTIDVLERKNNKLTMFVLVGIIIATIWGFLFR